MKSVTPTVYQNGTAHQLKPLVLTYTPAQGDSYIDMTYHTQDGSHHYNIWTWWQYLATYLDTQTGVGASISYGRAYNNTHGTPNNYNDNRYDPSTVSITTLSVIVVPSPTPMTMPGVRCMGDAHRHDLAKL